MAESEARRLKAWVGYLTLAAPFDGVIVARNANTFDFVLPATGDPTAMERSPYLSHSGAAAPIYVVDRTDVVRIFVDIPEQDANYVHIGTKATVLVQAYRDEPIPGTVTRTSWALNVKSRTLRAEIDLPNPGSQLLPGMYAYAEVIIERPGVRALPLAALTYRGDQAFCWKYENGKAVRTEIRDGRQRRRLDRGHQSSRAGLAGRARRQAILDADRRLGTGDPRRPVDPHRGRAGAGCPGDGRDECRQGRRPAERRKPPLAHAGQVSHPRRENHWEDIHARAHPDRTGGTEDCSSWGPPASRLCGNCSSAR